ncbi:hypothetical protein [Streptomyces hiroshimensis]|uniref:Uncharacterized protein n=1 Tax=Streptomyces hiroshimensis TaxID=66424 RepID=A0ABQ2Z466_9ACTN|nr:hypothetical protein [Streptomyces hiroshimensis]GGY02768.1 hypothetical protein GCM10010324_57190 [Streptomyces hiroshimensis]
MPSTTAYGSAEATDAPPGGLHRGKAANGPCAATPASGTARGSRRPAVVTVGAGRHAASCSRKAAGPPAPRTGSRTSPTGASVRHSPQGRSGTAGAATTTGAESLRTVRGRRHRPIGFTAHPAPR